MRRRPAINASTTPDIAQIISAHRAGQPAAETAGWHLKQPPGAFRMASRAFVPLGIVPFSILDEIAVGVPRRMADQWKRDDEANEQGRHATGDEAGDQSRP